MSALQSPPATWVAPASYEARSALPATPETVWPMVSAGCCAKEIAEGFGLSVAGAVWAIRMAKRKHMEEVQ